MYQCTVDAFQIKKYGSRIWYSETGFSTALFGIIEEQDR